MKDLFWDSALDTVNSVSFLKANKNPEKRQWMHKLQSLKVCAKNIIWREWECDKVSLTAKSNIKSKWIIFY